MTCGRHLTTLDDSSFFQNFPRTEEAQTNFELVDLTESELSEGSSVEILEVS